MTSVSCFFDEFVGTAVLLIVVMALGDARNGPPPAGLVPLVLFIMILGIGAALGMQTGMSRAPVYSPAQIVFSHSSTTPRLRH